MIKMDAYQATARLRKQAAIAHRKQRWQQAQEVAKQASDFLKQEYGNKDLETVVERSQQIWEQYQTSQNDQFLDGVALNLHSFCN